MNVGVIILSLIKFNGRELLDFAIAIETKGEELYRRLAAKCDNLQAAQLFHQLAEEESQHKADFVKMGEDFKEIHFRESYPGEYEEYLSNLIDNHLLYKAKDVDQLITKTCDAKSALELALNFEKDSLLFFMELSKLVVQNGQCTLEKLINTEQKHVNKLINTIKNL